MNVDLPPRLTRMQMLALRGSVSMTKSRGLPGSRILDRDKEVLSF